MQRCNWSTYLGVRNVQRQEFERSQWNAFKASSDSLVHCQVTSDFLVIMHLFSAGVFRSQWVEEFIQGGIEVAARDSG